MNDQTLKARLKDAEEALRGLHRRVIEAERELAETRAKLAQAERARERAEDHVEALLGTKTMRVLRVPREAYARLRRR
jgi:septal ring factor EnvC (AmiA/AmiB activator)